VLRIRIRDPVPFRPLDLGSGIGKKQDPDPGSGSGTNIPDHISESIKTIFWVKILNSLMRMRIRIRESFLTWIREEKIPDP
jgi:hypothetical protein